MMKVNYEELANSIDKDFTIYREEDYVYLLYPDPQKSGNILFQERGDIFVVWSNEYRLKEMNTVYDLIKHYVPYDLLFPYIDSQEEYDAVRQIGGEAIEFRDEDADDAEGISKEYGSLIVRHQHGV